MQLAEAQNIQRRTGCNHFSTTNCSTAYSGLWSLILTSDQVGQSGLTLRCFVFDKRVKWRQATAGSSLTPTVRNTTSTRDLPVRWRLLWQHSKHKKIHPVAPGLGAEGNDSQHAGESVTEGAPIKSHTGTSNNCDLTWRTFAHWRR